MDKDEILERFGLLDKEGFSIGTTRIFDLGNDLINEIIQLGLTTQTYNFPRGSRKIISGTVVSK